MEIVDAQIHRPPPSSTRHAGLAPSENLNYDIELSLAAMDAVGVDAAVVHWNDDGFCEAAASRYPDRFAGVLQLPGLGSSRGRFEDIPCNPEETIAGLRRRPGVLGFRVVVSFPASGARMFLLREGHLERWFAAAEKHGVPMCIFLSGHLAEVARIARDYSGLSIIIDHLGMMPVPVHPRTADVLDTLPDLLALAQFPNVAVKFTGVASLSAEDYPFSDLVPSVSRVLAAFGPQRLMWGSDYTRVQGLRTYAELLDFLKYSGEISTVDKEFMLGRAARHWLQWPRLKPP